CTTGIGPASPSHDRPPQRQWQSQRGEHAEDDRTPPDREHRRNHADGPEHYQRARVAPARPRANGVEREYLTVVGRQAFEPRPLAWSAVAAHDRQTARAQAAVAR